MRKILIMVLFSMFLFSASGCSSCSNRDKNAEKLSKLKSPVVVVSKGASHSDFGHGECYVVFRDSMGNIITLEGDEFTTLNVGDTLGVTSQKEKDLVF